MKSAKNARDTVYTAKGANNEIGPLHAWALAAMEEAVETWCIPPMNFIGKSPKEQQPRIVNEHIDALTNAAYIQWRAQHWRIGNDRHEQGGR